MTYFKPILISLFSLAALLPFFSSKKKRYQENIDTAGKMPNVLIVTVDDMTYNSIGAFGCTIPGITPNIDKLAAEGKRFTHAFTNTAVCQPCRQTLQTGRYPHNNGAEGFEPIDMDVPTLSELLKKAGYINGILGMVKHLLRKISILFIEKVRTRLEILLQHQTVVQTLRQEVFNYTVLKD